MTVSPRSARHWLRGATATVVVAAGLAAVPATGVAAPVPVAPTTPAAVVTHLITGDTVAVRALPGGRTSVEVATAGRSGPAAAWSSSQAGGHSYVFPTVAKPYLGRVLDPSLFELTTAGDTGRVAVDLTFAAGSKPAVPGFTATATTTTTARGYLTTSSARQFGAALLARWKTDMTPGHTPAASLFGVTRISRTGAVAPAQPTFPQITLVLKVTAADGTPADGAIVSVLDTDDIRRFAGTVFVTDGEARISVPKGHYSALAEAPDFDPATGAFSDALVTLPDFTVTTNLQRVAIDMGTATVTPSVSTPLPAALSELDLEWDRIVGADSYSFGFGFGPGSDVKVAPAPAPVVGRVEWVTTWSLAASPPRTLPYRYDLSFDDSGAIPADQHRTVAASQLARLYTTYRTDGPPRLPAFGRSAVYPFQFFVFTSLVGQPGPLSRTEYLAAPPSAGWYDISIAASNDVDFFAGFTSDGLRQYPAGSRQPIDWLRGPLAPGVDSPTNASASDYYSFACRTDGRIALALDPFTDSTPGHAGSAEITDPDNPVATFVLRRGGAVARRLTNSTGGVFATPAAASVYSATVETFLGQMGFQNSTHAVTTLTFPSAAGQGAPLPDGWRCGAGSDATVLPLLRATVPLPTDLADTMPLGDNTVTITPAAGAPAAAVRDVHLATSLDAGTTFTQAPVTALGGNRFRATITHTAGQAGKPVTLRVSGATAAGSAITETVTNAYTVQES